MFQKWVFRDYNCCFIVIYMVFKQLQYSGIFLPYDGSYNRGRLSHKYFKNYVLKPFDWSSNLRFVLFLTF